MKSWSPSTRRAVQRSPQRRKIVLRAVADEVKSTCFNRDGRLLNLLHLLEEQDAALLEETLAWAGRSPDPVVRNLADGWLRSDA